MQIYNQNTKTKKRSSVDYVIYRSALNTKKPRWFMQSSYFDLNEVASYLKRKSEYYEMNNIPEKERSMFKIVKRLTKSVEVPINKEIMLMRIEHGI